MRREEKRREEIDNQDMFSHNPAPKPGPTKPKPVDCQKQRKKSLKTTQK
jgi:hypothetical protein